MTNAMEEAKLDAIDLSVDINVQRNVNFPPVKVFTVGPDGTKVPYDASPGLMSRVNAALAKRAAARAAETTGDETTTTGTGDNKAAGSADPATTPPANTGGGPNAGDGKTGDK